MKTLTSLILTLCLSSSALASETVIAEIESSRRDHGVPSEYLKLSFLGFGCEIPVLDLRASALTDIHLRGNERLEIVDPAMRDCRIEPDPRAVFGDQADLLKPGNQIRMTTERRLQIVDRWGRRFLVEKISVTLLGREFASKAQLPVER